MTDKLIYAVRGWQERVEPLREWWPAGTLAAKVLELPTKRVGLLAALAGLDAAGDQDRFRKIAPLSATRQAWMEARAFAEVHVERARAFAEVHVERADGATSREVPLGFAPRLLVLSRNAEHFVVTPARAVALSAAFGVARGTLRECKQCGRFLAARRAEFARRYCETCASTRRPFGKTSPPDNDAKTTWFRRVNERVYRRILREDREHQALRRTGRLLRKKRPLSLEAKQAYATWRQDVLRRLLATDDLDALERQVAPKRTPGPKPKTVSSPRTTRRDNR